MRRVRVGAASAANGSSTWSLIARERSPRARRVVAARVMEVERGAVVDQPQPPVPHQHVGVARRAVDVASRTRRTRRSAEASAGVGRVGDRVERDRARQVVERRG